VGFLREIVNSEAPLSRITNHNKMDKLPEHLTFASNLIPKLARTTFLPPQRILVCQQLCFHLSSKTLKPPLPVNQSEQQSRLPGLIAALMSQRLWTSPAF
jgi:hypothetical protein